MFPEIHNISWNLSENSFVLESRAFPNFEEDIIYMLKKLNRIETGSLDNYIIQDVFFFFTGTEVQTLPEAQRPQGSDSLTWVISPAK